MPLWSTLCLHGATLTLSAVLVHYLHEWSCRKQIEVRVESQDSQGDRGDVHHTENRLFQSFLLYQMVYSGRKYG